MSSIISDCGPALVRGEAAFDLVEATEHAVNETRTDIYGRPVTAEGQVNVFGHPYPGGEAAKTSQNYTEQQPSLVAAEPAEPVAWQYRSRIVGTIGEPETEWLKAPKHVVDTMASKGYETRALYTEQQPALTELRAQAEALKTTTLGVKA